MLLLQLVLTKYCQIGSYVFICILPAMILCLPTSQPTWMQLLIAFACGMFVDALADGCWGLNAAALVPVAFMQKFLIRVFISDEIVERGYSFSFWTNGIIKVGVAMLVSILIYMSIYAVIDCAGERSGWFMFYRILFSSLVSGIFSLAVINILCPRPAR